MPKQILLVEDSVTMQKVVEITFAHEEYRISSTREADEALARIRDDRPDVVLADAGLPGKSGYDLASIIKNDAALRDIPVVLLTGNFNPYDEARGQKAGVDAHVVKPFETQVLIDKVADLLRRRTSVPTPTLVSMPPLQNPAGQQQPMAGTGQAEGRRPTVPPLPPPRATVPQQVPQPQGRPAMSGAAVDPGIQRSTLMGIPAVNPLGAPGMRPPPPPGMRVRETGNHPAINPPPIANPAPLPSWAARPGEARAPTTGSQPLVSSPGAATIYGGQSPASQILQGGAPQATGIPQIVPQMPRPSLIPRAPVPATVLAVLERIAARGAEYEAIAKLSVETIEQIVWEVVPDLAEAIIRSELDRLVKEREQKA